MNIIDQLMRESRNADPVRKQYLKEQLDKNVEFYIEKHRLEKRLDFIKGEIAKIEATA